MDLVLKTLEDNPLELLFDDDRIDIGRYVFVKDPKVAYIEIDKRYCKCMFTC